MSTTIPPATAQGYVLPDGEGERIWIVGDRPGRMLIAFSPGGMDGFLRESGRPAVDDGPAPPTDADEIARTEAAGERYGARVASWGD